MRLRRADDVAAVEREYQPEALRPADTILGCLRTVADEDPGKRAMLLVEPPDFFTPVREVSFDRLVTDIEQTASLFHDVAGDVRSAVAIMLPMVPEGLSALWGAQTAGVGIPVNPFLELDGLVRLLSDAEATAIVTTREVMEEKGGPETLTSRVPSLRRVFYVDDPAGDPALDLAAVAAEYAGRGLTFAADDDPWRDAMLMPTGGTTGGPKLVRMSQAGQLTVAWNVAALMGNEVDGVTAHGMPNFHCGGTISLGLRTLMFGGTLLTLTRTGFRSRDAVAAFWDIARHYRVTSLLATPTTALALLDGEGSSDGCCLRDFHVGGSALPTDLVERFHDRFGVWLRENWGMTELHGTTTGHFNDGRMPRVGSAGRALPFVRVKTVELDANGAWARNCAPGERGLLLTATPTAMAGYVNPELDADFYPAGVPGDLPSGWRWGNTGDLGTVDEDGYVWVFGRAKDVIIRGGHNIDPKEIEDVLGRHPAVHIAAAVGRPDRAKGELPIVFVQLRDGAAATAEELLVHCRQYVQEKAAAPVEVVIVDEVPLTPVGKVSKPALRADALLREVRSVVAQAGGRSEVELDESGTRPRVIVRVDGTPAMAAEIERALTEYEFETRVYCASSEPDNGVDEPAPSAVGAHT
jgi:fatty-acyl-CoA synthase